VYYFVLRFYLCISLCDVDTRSDWWIMNWNGFRRKSSWLNLRNCPWIFQEGLKSVESLRPNSRYPGQDWNMGLLEFMSGRVTAAVACSALNLLPCVGVKPDLSFCIGNRMLRGIHRPKRGRGAVRGKRKNCTLSSSVIGILWPSEQHYWKEHSSVSERLLISQNRLYLN